MHLPYTPPLPPEGWYDYLHSLTGDEEPPVQEEDYDYEQEARQSQEEGGHEQQEETGVPADTGCGRKMVRGPESLLRIIGGREASRGAWPWQVAVLNRFKVRSMGFFRLF